MKLRSRALEFVVGTYLVAFGMLSGVVLDRMIFDHERSRILHRYERALQQWHDVRMDLERRVLDRP
jgi:hypothetical protein